MRNIDTIIRNCFEDITFSNNAGDSITSDEKRRIMAVPVSGDIIEVPVFALPILSKEGSDKTKSIAIDIKKSSRRCTYKSLESCVRETLRLPYNKAFLVKLPPPKNSVTQYYGTQGAIFDENYIPIALFNWRLRKVYTDENKLNYRYTFDCPILRVTPKVIVEKSTSVEKYIVNKIIPKTLSLRFLVAPTLPVSSFIKSTYGKTYQVEVIISDPPFKIIKPKAPSICTTNKELLNVVLDNIDDIM